QRGLLLVGDQLVCFAWRDDDDTCEGQITVRCAHLGQEPGRAADADDLRSVGHGSIFRSNRDHQRARWHRGRAHEPTAYAARKTPRGCTVAGGRRTALRIALVPTLGT